MLAAGGPSVVRQLPSSPDSCLKEHVLKVIMLLAQACAALEH